MTPSIAPEHASIELVGNTRAITQLSPKPVFVTMSSMPREQLAGQDAIRTLNSGEEIILRLSGIAPETDTRRYLSIKFRVPQDTPTISGIPESIYRMRAGGKTQPTNDLPQTVVTSSSKPNRHIATTVLGAVLGLGAAQGTGMMLRDTNFALALQWEDPDSVVCPTEKRITDRETPSFMVSDFRETKDLVWALHVLHQDGILSNAESGGIEKLAEILKQNSYAPLIVPSKEIRELIEVLNTLIPQRTLIDKLLSNNLAYSKRLDKELLILSAMSKTANDNELRRINHKALYLIINSIVYVSSPEARTHRCDMFEEPLMDQLAIVQEEAKKDMKERGELFQETKHKLETISARIDTRDRFGFLFPVLFKFLPSLFALILGAWGARKASQILEARKKEKEPIATTIEGPQEDIASPEKIRVGVKAPEAPAAPDPATAEAEREEEAANEQTPRKRKRRGR